MLRVAERLQLAAQLRDGMSRAWSPRSVPPPARRCTNSISGGRRTRTLQHGPARGGRRPQGQREIRQAATGQRGRTLPAKRPRPSPARGTTARSCAPAAASRWIARPSGSCVRRAATWPSIARCAKRFRFSSCARIPPVHRSDGYGRRAAGRRRSHHLRRLAADPRAAGTRSRIRRRRWPGHSQSAAIGRRSRALRELESVEPLEFVLETVRQTRAALPGHIPVIGFAGARSRWPATRSKGAAAATTRTPRP